jgi:hypothetical protein
MERRMDKLPRLLQCAQALRVASAAQDWAALKQADTEVAALLPTLAVSSEWSTAERAALRALKLAHREASTACATAGEALSRQMADLGTGRDGRIAYALHDTTSELTE